MSAIKPKIMKEFRLVFYMNASDAINFWGGRAAASPLAYYFHLNKQPKTKIFLGGPFRFIGLGKYKTLIKDELEKASKPVSLRKPLSIDGISISNKAYIYQNNDPLFTQAENTVYWEATIDKIGKCFTRKERKKHTQGAVKIGLATRTGRDREENNEQWRALISGLARLKLPVQKDNCPWKVYGGNGKPRRFWRDNGMPSIPRNNAFVHLTPRQWKKFDKSAKSNPLRATRVTDDQIKNTRIRESLVHELLKMIFAREGWWVNFEVPVRGGRIDFLVKRSASDPWTVIEVKLGDNPDAVEQLHTYIEAIRRDVKKHKADSYFWPLWEGGRRCTKPKGVVLCAAPGNDTLKEVNDNNYDFHVWTYKYTSEHNTLGIEVLDAKSKRRIVRTR